MTAVEGFDQRAFRHVLGHFPTGVAVITAIDHAGLPAGMAVGSFTSVSLDPPLVAFFADKASTSFPRIQTSPSFCVNVLSDEQEAVSRAFAAKASDKFRAIPWRPAPSGSPILDGVVAWIDCDVATIDDAGDHHMVLGRVRELEVAGQGAPLVFFRGGYGRFSRPTLAALAASGMDDPERTVALARTAVDGLATLLGAEAVAHAPAADRILVVAHAGPAHEPLPSRTGREIPFAPPHGPLFVAWDGDDAVEAWIARRGSGTSDAEARAYRALASRVRERGWSLTLAAYEPEEIGAAGVQHVRFMAVPVLGPAGNVVMQLGVHGPQRALTQRELEAQRDALRTAARELGDTLASAA